jgi:hypothetical protein
MVRLGTVQYGVPFDQVRTNHAWQRLFRHSLPGLDLWCNVPEAIDDVLQFFEQSLFSVLPDDIFRMPNNHHFREITLQNLVHDSLLDPATFLEGQLEGFNTFPILRVIARQFPIEECNDFCEYSLEQDRSNL